VTVAFSVFALTKVVSSILFRFIRRLYLGNYTKPVSTVLGQSAEVMRVKAGRTQLSACFRHLSLFLIVFFRLHLVPGSR
jgi:hypothetical protein